MTNLFQTRCMKQIAVIGSGGKVPLNVWLMAEEVGRAVASRGAVLICGGRGGVMEAACKGAKEVKGLTVGVLPGRREEANRYVDIAIATEMGDARNAVNVKSGDAVIAIHGGAGTLSEIGLAIKSGKKVIALKQSGGVAGRLAGEVIDGSPVLSALSVEEAVELAFEL